ncbi:winged helix-turn-helix domain-containing protein [Sphingomicrobium nitratireducens]|uniref:winged helix-turn-helix domain-containing protein n=1 Tax=Sphingomicrobium nitratireducens TaxID=2964666 RepID=UPI0022406C42|nr:winged helix-turn-helix domain-containing protein [Sphingomicrobium nitratireducens]
MATRDAEDLKIGEFVIDRNDERLYGPHGPVKLGNKAYCVLLALAERDGKLLTKDALFETVWDGMAVSESALTTTIRELRNALGDDSKTPTYVESVYGRGYRLLAPVENVPAGFRPDPMMSASAFENPAGNPPRVIVGRFKDEVVQQDHPFAADAIREEVLLGLSRFREIEVVAEQLDTIPPRDRHGRDYKLDATFLPDGEGVKIVARCKRLGDGRIVWAETVKLADTGMQMGVETIVRRIVGAALPALDQDLSLGLDQAGDTLFDRYLKAKRQSFEAHSAHDARQSMAKLEAIIDEQPSFALAYPPLVRLYNIDLGYNALGWSGPEQRQRALSLAKSGLAADRSHVHAYTVLGFCHLYNREFDQAEGCFDYAFERNPFNPSRLNEVAAGKVYLGDFDAAHRLIEQSKGIQPFADDPSHEDLGRLCLLEGDWDNADRNFRRIAIASIWSQLYAALCRLRFDKDEGADRMAAWKRRVHENWHRDERPGNERIFAWFEDHHPFKNGAGKVLIDAAQEAISEID